MNQRAHTLVEMMMVVGILAFLLVGIYGVLQTGNTIYTKDSNLLMMQQQTRNGLDRMVRDLRQASSQTITTVNSTADQIVFNTPTSTGAQYYLSGTNLMRKASSTAAASTIASNISLLKFTLSGTLLKIQTQASKTIYTNQVISFPLTEKVRLRNE